MSKPATTYASAIGAIKVTVGFVIGATFLSFSGVVDKASVVRPFAIPLWKRLLIAFVREWAQTWPFFAVLVFVVSFATIALWHRCVTPRT